MALVEPDDLRNHLTAMGAASQALAVADQAAETASTFVAAYCSRLRVDDPVPPVVAQVAKQLAVRLAVNPRSIRSVSAEGQSTDLPTPGFTYLESILVNPYRRRTA